MPATCTTEVTVLIRNASLQLHLHTFAVYCSVTFLCGFFWIVCGFFILGVLLFERATTGGRNCLFFCNAFVKGLIRKLATQWGWSAETFVAVRVFTADTAQHVWAQVAAPQRGKINKTLRCRCWRGKMGNSQRHFLNRLSKKETAPNKSQKN